MIKLTLEEGYAFDVFAICQVKYKMIHSRYKEIGQQLAVLTDEIVGQIGERRFLEITESPEYQALFEANRKTFELVEECRRGEDGLAKRTDAANLERHKAKNALQTKFFGTNLKEIKT